MEKKRLGTILFPLIFEQLLAVSVGMVDTFMVSTVGQVAVSGVALVDNINRLVIQVMSAFAAGGIVVTSQYIGNKKYEMSEKSCAQLEILMNVFSVITMVICVLFGRSILGCLFGQIEHDVMEAAHTYLVVSGISFVFLGVYNTGAAILRCQEDTKTSMIVSLVMNIINVVFNAWFVFGLHMGVLGVALATLISRAVAGIIMKLLLLSNRNRLRIREIKMYRPSFSMVKKILSIGIPSGIENGMFQIGKLLVVSMVATLGTDAIAANSIGYQIIDFPNIPGVSIGLALVVIVGQDIGAGDKELAVSDSKRLLKLAYIGDWICKILLFVTAPWLVSVFSLSVAASEMAVTVLRCFSIAALPIWPLSFTLPNALRGAGDAKFTMIVSILSMWICRIVICYILVMWCDFGILGVWLGMFVDWYVRGISYSLRYLSKKWLNKRVI
ncbi:MAG: MATE family efflux transporter [Lachnospiraceae bacterium]|nr:MATE family efflux transporter [Lachnospiraceae bacterium]